MVETIQTRKETAKTEAHVETATSKTEMAAGEMATSTDMTETCDKTEMTVSGIKTETQAAIREAKKSETIMILEPKIRK